MAALEKLLAWGGLVLTEGSSNEVLRRHPRIELDPIIVNSGLLTDPVGREVMTELYLTYLDIARRLNNPIIMLAPTWRANRERLKKAGRLNDRLNEEAVRFMRQIIDRSGIDPELVSLAGLMACRGDCYRAEEALSPDEAEEFHSWQAERLAEAGADFVQAATMPAVGEAEGLTRALGRVGLGALISFVIRPDGTVLDGTPLPEAIARLDERCSPRPIGCMVNCVHPNTLDKALAGREFTAAPPDRLLGLQANSSDLPFEQLEGSSATIGDEPAVWAEAMVRVGRRWGLKILGGCCGAGPDHIQALGLGLAQA